jgi:purine-binding chemotaxis protein CheW
MSDETPRIDWQQIHEQLARARVKLEQGFELPADKQRELLKARAREQARRSSSDAPPEPMLEVIEFRLAGSHYAVETRWAREVWPLRELTPVPCTPPFVRGVINVRGRILSVLDLRRFFELPISGLGDLNKAIILRSAALEVGILADQVLGVRQLPLAQLQSAALPLAGVRAEYLRGVTSDAIIVLAADQLLADPRLIVREEV